MSPSDFAPAQQDLPADSAVTVSRLPLNYALSLLSQLLPVPVHIFRADNHYYQYIMGENDSDDWNVLKTDLKLRTQMLQEVRRKKICLFVHERPVLFGGVQCGDDLTLIVGPVVISATDQSFAKLYALKHEAVNVSLMTCSPNRLASFLLLIHAGLGGDIIPLTGLLDTYFLTPQSETNTESLIARVTGSHLERNKPHNPGVFEDSIRLAIKKGDAQALLLALNSPFASMRGVLSPNELRSAQNLAIVDITIATRAAIDAGLSPEELYILSDAFILEVENCRFVNEANSVARTCALRCAALVKSHLEQKENGGMQNTLVVRARDYLERHLFDSIDLKDLASALKVSLGYLSRIFKEQQGCTLTEFVRRRKIDIARLMLVNSDKSLSEIADLLSFSSQSHFGRVFLKETGISPAVYRRTKSINKMLH